MNDVVDVANNLVVQRIVARYLAPENASRVQTIEGVCVQMIPTWRRSGVPADATCWRYVFEHPEFGWSFVVRAVWRDGSLMRPVATHTIIEGYDVDDEDLLADADAARDAVSDWLQTVPL